MKRTTLVIIAMLLTASVYAQISKEDLAIYQSVKQKEKTEQIKKHLILTKTQAKAFWPLYDAFEAKELELSNKRAYIINDYLKKFDKLSGKDATDLFNRQIINDRDFIDLQKASYQRFYEAIGGVNTLKFFQLENYMLQVIRLHILDELPFIGEKRQ
ncbi:hypothetical protein ACFGVR_20055 [Mucilaginibacter sp. AW1-3]